MSIDSKVEETQEQNQVQNKSKDDNLVQLRKIAEQERSARLAAEEKAAQYEKMYHEKSRSKVEDEEDEDPYDVIDHRKLDKKLSKFNQKSRQETESVVENAVQQALAKERQRQWLKSNPDFAEVMEHADILAQKDPELAEIVLTMPDNFERQKLVYKNIKAYGAHRKEEPKETIQDKINQNMRSPYYQPSGVGTSPYQGYVLGGKDYSDSEKLNSFNKMKELQKKIRL